VLRLVKEPTTKLFREHLEVIGNGRSDFSSRPVLGQTCFREEGMLQA